MHGKQRRPLCACDVIDRENFLEVVAAIVLGEEAPVLLGKQLQVHHQRVAFELKPSRQLMGIEGLFIDCRKKQRYGTHHISRGLRKQVQVVGDAAAQRVDLIGLRWQFNGFVTFATAVLGEKTDRTFAGVE
ncbi:hypothetical protein D9M71_753150 [compost metagenome]